VSITTDIHSGAPSVPDEIEGDGWHAALCIAWAQITDGGATCDYCAEPARVMVATGADPAYVPMCWGAASGFIQAAVSFGALAFGSQSPEGA
jgi:hypothetical protein